MMIRFTHTVEYEIDIDDDDTEGLEEINRLLRNASLQGYDLGERLAELHRTDDHTAMVYLAEASSAEVVDESWVCDDYTEPEVSEDDDDDDDEDEDENQDDALVLPVFVTGDGFVSRSLT